MTERGYIIEKLRGYRFRNSGPVYWVTKGSATDKPEEAGVFTREEFEAIHDKTELSFIPLEVGLAGPSDTESKDGK